MASLDRPASPRPAGYLPGNEQGNFTLFLLRSSKWGVKLGASCNAFGVAARIGGCASDVTGFRCGYRDPVNVVEVTPAERSRG